MVGQAVFRTFITPCWILFLHSSYIHQDMKRSFSYEPIVIGVYNDITC